MDFDTDTYYSDIDSITTNVSLVTPRPKLRAMSRIAPGTKLCAKLVVMPISRIQSPATTLNGIAESMLSLAGGSAKVAASEGIIGQGGSSADDDPHAV